MSSKTDKMVHLKLHDIHLIEFKLLHCNNTIILILLVLVMLLNIRYAYKKTSLANVVIAQRGPWSTSLTLATIVIIKPLQESYTKNMDNVGENILYEKIFILSRYSCVKHCATLVIG